MVRTISTEALAACPFSIAEAYALAYFRLAESGSAEADIHAPLRFIPVVLRRRVGLTFAAHADGAETGRMHDELRVHWSGRTPLLPDFHGIVRLRISGLQTRVLVEGSYEAPFGTLGRLFDELGGKHIALASLRDLADRLAAYLELRERVWRSDLASA